jgi:DNA-binding GntR family transcriptional regulator
MVRTLVEQVHRELRERVFAGRWHLGERLYEEAIAVELAVSRAPVREAIRMLEQEGLIVRVPHRGLFVAAPDPAEIVQTAATRALLEAFALRWGRAHTATEIGRLIESTEAMDSASDRGDTLEAVTQDLNFHATVVSVCDNAVLLRHFHELDGYMALFLHALTDTHPARLRAMGERHRKIARRLGDRAMGETAIVDHYRSAALALVEQAGESTTRVDWPAKWRLA